VITYYHQNAGKDYNLLMANKSTENLAKFKYFKTTVTNKISSMRKLRAD
jgi:hypothetical protein